MLLAAAAIPAALSAQTPAPAGASVRALRASEPIRLDGVLDEPAWLAADSITDFRQQEPEEGAPARERTVVRVLTADAGIYIGLWAYQDPSRIVRSHLRRDADLEEDDFFAFLFDPQRDHRSAYAFAVNANGSMADGEVKGPEDVALDWNGIWDARALITDDGWVAEIFVPWQTLRYRHRGGAWGFNVIRGIRHRNEYVLWRSWQRQRGFFYLPEEGTLEGLGELPRRRLVETRPYISSTGSLAERVYRAGGTDSVTAASAAAVALGLDAKVAVAPTLTLDLTVNTDFAQVEADRQVVNLTRFPLFFPEKRPFFLEASDIFDFGQEERVQLFHSRRIGLASGGTPIPISWGARLTGRAGPERIGLLATRTAGDEDALDLATRFKHDAFTRGYVGGMITAHGGPGVRGARLAGGADFEFPLLVRGQNLIPTALMAWSRDSAGAPARSAWRVFLDYPNDHADHFLAVSRIENGFDPALGFVRQDGIWRHTGALRFFPRPHRWGIRRLLFTVLQFDINTTLNGELDNSSYQVRPFGAQFEGGGEVALTLQRFEEVVPPIVTPGDSFEIFPGTVVLPGRYEWSRAELSLESSTGRPVQAEVQFSAGDYFSGTATEVESQVTVKVAPHFIGAAEWAVQRIRLATGRFTAQAVSVRLDVAANPRLAGAAFLQWDNESERLAVNARVHWIPRPGSDAYLVWNSAWPTGLGRGIPWQRPLRGALVGKLVYYFRV
ncbi:MAG: carbohydrate binding family 9 domain-containing protein [Gemmatimonadetes bacterium]|nr:carbohydrate binding family 9 domain-containing protein [Gemmatimonadota bacterium]